MNEFVPLSVQNRSSNPGNDPLRSRFVETGPAVIMQLGTHVTPSGRTKAATRVFGERYIIVDDSGIATHRHGAANHMVATALRNSVENHPVGGDHRQVVVTYTDCDQKSYAAVRTFRLLWYNAALGE